jgi:CMP/dCMP kinase
LGKFNIALDGPAGAGKSTVARMVARELDYVYVDTGSMYRAITWKVLINGVPLEDIAGIARMAASTRISLKPGPLGQTVYADGQEVTEEIRTNEINLHVSHIAAIPAVREILVRMQKEMASGKGVVMDGRDIGTSVLPDAEVKVFLTASARKRAERRYQELKVRDITLDELEKDIERRDQLDCSREVSPLRQAQDAVLLDSTDMSLEEVVHAVLELCRTKMEWR